MPLEIIDQPEEPLFFRPIERIGTHAVTQSSPAFYAGTLRNILVLMIKHWFFQRFVRKLWADPNRFDYVDAAIAPVGSADFETFELYTATRGGKEALASHRKTEGIKKRARAKVAAGV
ncbi:hypothetical protein [Roseibium sediminicola]|uniref:Uncharacterized protein n=1 Tax=Roseibium sediminicola TaxID=2933272 RepID=A0ABT0GVX9_9HYPH|nr:hypothetical protein [Roseibium sp. CAU 1639]MCK7613597.1 hypothetical protein [Roseibium sp. CAU 1639]